MKHYLKSFNILSEDEINQFSDLGKLRTLKKGEFFIKEGKVCREVAFIISGVLRSFYHSSSGEEVTYCFSFPGSFITAYSSFISQSETTENIRVLTKAEMLTFSRDEILGLKQSSISWLRFFKTMAEQEYIKMEKRIFLLQKENAEKRYDDLLTNHPQFLQSLPLNHLASYLGITQRHLSRIRKTRTK